MTHAGSQRIAARVDAFVKDAVAKPSDVIETKVPQRILNTRPLRQISAALEINPKNAKSFGMDVVAHGLWGGAAFYPQSRRKFLARVLIGMAPDLLSFGVYHVLNPSWITMRLAGEISGPPALAILPPYLFVLYNVSHSLVVWTVSFLLVWLSTKQPPWLLSAWLLHIVCDIPTHTESHFPTPFLWSFPTPFVDGIPWSTPWLMTANYATMITVYCAMFFYFNKKR